MDNLACMCCPVSYRFLRIWPRFLTIKGRQGSDTGRRDGRTAKSGLGRRWFQSLLAWMGLPGLLFISA